ncbi:MAG: hypothetical protein QXO02_08220 [Thermofilaceae archaeon]
MRGELFIVELHTRGLQPRQAYLKVKFYRALKKHSVFTLGRKHIVPQSRLRLVDAAFRLIRSELGEGADVWYTTIPLRAVGPSENIIREVWAKYEEILRALERRGGRGKKLLEDAEEVASFLGPEALRKLHELRKRLAEHEGKTYKQPRR